MSQSNDKSHHREAEDKEIWATTYKALRSRRGYCKSNYKSPGFCDLCYPHPTEDSQKSEDNIAYQWDEGIETLREHKEKDCKNPPFCEYHGMIGHLATLRCERMCRHCMKHGHSMQFCKKLKNCVLCGKSGHNPRNCWQYDCDK